MKIKNLHPWHISIKEAEKIQIKLQKKTIFNSPFSSIRTIKNIVGADVNFIEGKNLLTAGLAVFSFPELNILEKVRIEKKVNQLFPYIPGLLAFREIPPLLDAFKKLKTEPDVILCDGQGIAHPRKMGLATHLGIILDKPTIGCAKSLLYGRYEKMPDRFNKSYTYLRDERGNLSTEALAKAEIIGVILRTKDSVRPVFVSAGYRMSLKLATELVLSCCTKYRIPEPLRFAHQITKLNF
jgi:deoxyribonuclease V